MIEAKLNWIGGMQFVGKTASGHAILMDTLSKFGGENTALAPMELLLVSLAGCTGMDVVSILRKMNVKFDSLEIKVGGERVCEHPKVYKKIDLIYEIKGRNLPEDKIKHAVELSQERYCSISEMLRKTAEITYTIRVG